MGFDVLFLPEGIPFKQDTAFPVTIKKEYTKPSKIKEHYGATGWSFDEEGQKIFDQFLEDSEEDMESLRKETYDAWAIIKI